MPISFPGRIIDSVNGMVGRVKLALLKTVSFNATNTRLLEFKDQDGNVIDSVEISQDNELVLLKIPLTQTTLTQYSTDAEVRAQVASWIAVNYTQKLDIQTISWEIVNDTLYVEEGYVSPNYTT